MSSFPEHYVPGFHYEDQISKMEYNVLGSTGLKVSKLSLGTGGFSYFYGKFDIEECRETVHEALKSGINYIDTGPWYGHGVAEEILGKCLEGIPRKAYYIGTKVGRYEKDPKNMFDFSANKTLESIDITLKRLKLDYVDVLQIHDIEFAPSLDILLNETLPALQQILKSGKAKYIGITGYPVQTLREFVEKSSVQINTVMSYCRQTMIDNALADYIPFFKEKKVGVINAAANSMGLLSNFGPPDWHPAPQNIKEACSEAREYCRKIDVELGTLAVYHSFQQPGPDTVLVGMNNLKLLEMNLNTLYKGLSEKELAAYEEVKKILSKVNELNWENIELEQYWTIIKSGENAGFWTPKEG